MPQKREVVLLIQSCGEDGNIKTNAIMGSFRLAGEVKDYTNS